MRITTVILFAMVTITSAGCGATRADNRTGTFGGPGLTGATVTFYTRDNGKDADSTVGIELLRNNAELAAETRLVGTKFGDNAMSGPLALSMAAPFREADIGDARVRIRLVPDGKDVWNFDMQLALTFADGTTRRFSWTAVGLDNAAPERTLPLAPARSP